MGGPEAIQKDFVSELPCGPSLCEIESHASWPKTKYQAEWPRYTRSEEPVIARATGANWTGTQEGSWALLSFLGALAFGRGRSVVASRKLSIRPNAQHDLCALLDL